jgi:hypothetical protein
MMRRRDLRKATTGRARLLPSRLGVARKSRLGGRFVLPAMLLLGSVRSLASAQTITKTEHFDTDLNWDSHNNRATTPEPRQVQQDFGYSATTTWAGGPAGEVGGFITPTAEPAWYAKILDTPLTFNDAFSASGKFNMQFGGGGHTLLGFFNSDTAKEWRTANALSLRIYGRGNFFYAYPEYGTAKWRAGASSFPGAGDDFHFPAGFTTPIHTFSIDYNPNGPAGTGLFTATIDAQTAVCTVSADHRTDGATFNRFGFLDVMKSVDGAGRIWMDNISINHGPVQTFTSDPNWEGFNNRTTYSTTVVRPRFDFGYSPATHKAGGAGSGEIGGTIWRGDSDPQYNGAQLAYYGDPLQQTLDLDHPLHAAGKISFNRGVSDSTALIGFFHHADSMRNEISDYSIPENFVGAAIEGPSSEGFFFYPTFGTNVEDSHGDGGNAPYIYPDGASHNWQLDYDPLGGNADHGRINLTLDGTLATIDLTSGDRNAGAHFDRFGIISTQHDGLFQDVYFDDLTYTVALPEPSTAAATAVILAGACAARRRRRRVARLAILPALVLAPGVASAQMITKLENFNVDPGWDGHNNRSTFYGPANVTENYGYNFNRIGGGINPTGEVNYFAQTIPTKTLNDSLTFSGTVNNNGGGNSWLGLFNSATPNEWRTANSLSLRIYGRGSYFLAYPEYGTSKWRAGAGGFVNAGNEVQFPINTPLSYNVVYNPAGNGGGGTITATLNGQTSTVNLDAGHKLDTASFNRFGLGGINKSYDSAGNVFLDDVNVNNAGVQNFTGSAPGWSGVNNNASYSTNNVRFRFDFGFSNTHNISGGTNGEIGGNFFRGDSRQAETMAFYGGPLNQTLDLTRALHADGKVTFKRGVTDSTVMFGFFHNTDSVRVSTAQANGTPEDWLGAVIEGPSSEGFNFYPSYKTDLESNGSGGSRGDGNPPYIYPDSAVHNWTLDYDPNGSSGLGRIVVSLDGQQQTMTLNSGDKAIGAHFNRFGFITPQVDGNGQTVFLDDITYTVGFAVTPQWAINSDGDWNTPGNWSGNSVPNGVGAQAIFSNNNTAGRIVYTNSPVTLGTLSFGSPNTWLLAGLGTLTMQTSSGSAQVNVTQGSHKINLPLSIASSTVLSVSSGAQLTIADPVTIGAGKTLTQSGSGTVTFQSTVSVGTGGSFAITGDADVRSLALATGATADVNGRLRLRESTTAAAVDQLKQAQIVSSSSTLDPSGATTLGIADDPAGGVLVKYTYLGDADLSGSPDSGAFDRFRDGIDRKSTATWASGDFDYDGVVDAADFRRFVLGLENDPNRLVSGQFFAALSDFAAAQNLNIDLSAVPEPAALLWFCALAPFVRRRRRRCRRCSAA